MVEGRIESEAKIEESIKEILADAPDYVTSWYKNLQAKDITVKSCRDYLHKVMGFLKASSITKLSDVTPEVLDDYFVSIKYKTDASGNKIHTSLDYRHSVWFALNNFFEYQLYVKTVSENYMKGVKPPRKKKKDDIKKNRLTAADFQRMLDNAPGESEEYKVRNKAILLIYMTTGMRRDALCQINLDDLDLINNTLRITDKGDIDHVYELNQTTIDAITQWMLIRNSLNVPSSLRALFLSSRKTRITGNAVYEMVRESSQKALGHSISPHKLRGGYCSILYEQTHDIEFVCKAVGHSDPSITHRYVTTDHKEKQKASNIFSSLLH